MSDAETRIRAAAACVIECLDGFEFAGLRLETGGPRALAAEFDLELPEALPGSIQLDIVHDDVIVGEISRGVFIEADELHVGERQFKIRDAKLRRRGFGSAAQRLSEDCYRRVGIVAIHQEAEGDGSLLAARRGYDFDIERYRTLERYRDASDATIRAGAIKEMLRRPGVYETVEHDDAPRRESVSELLERLHQGSELARTQVADLLAVLPGDDADRDGLTGLRSPAEIAAFGRPLEELDGATIGRELLRRTSWTARKPPL